MVALWNSPLPGSISYCLFPLGNTISVRCCSSSTVVVKRWIGNGGRYSIWLRVGFKMVSVAQERVSKTFVWHQCANRPHHPCADRRRNTVSVQAVLHRLTGWWNTYPHSALSGWIRHFLLHTKRCLHLIN